MANETTYSGIFWGAQQQAILTAAKPYLSQELETTMEDVQSLMTLSRKGARHHLGKRSKKLAEFGLRGRKAGNKPVPPPKPTPASSNR